MNKPQDARPEPQDAFTMLEEIDYRLSAGLSIDHLLMTTEEVGGEVVETWENVEF